METAPFLIKRSALGTLCTLALGLALSSCASAPKVASMVEAQRKPTLDVSIRPGTIGFTPMPDGSSVAFTVTVSGLRNADEANKLKLDISTETELPWLSLQAEGSEVSGNVHSFFFHANYLGSAFSEAPAVLKLHLQNIPEGYECPAKTLRVAPMDGLQNTRPIPVHQTNLLHFNLYANTEEGLKRHYQLIENVTLSKPADGQSNWTAIGSASSPFTGSFDGGGHTLSGLTLVGSSNNQGLFGYIRGKNAAIQNLGLEDVHVTSRRGVGGLVGWNNAGTVQNCHVAGSVNGDMVVGGLVGTNTGTVQNCYATGNVTLSLGMSVGGLVGTNSGTVQNCYSAGEVRGNTVVGGVVGANSGTVQNCYATGNVSGTGASNFVGGVVGGNGGTVQNCYATGNVSASGVINSVGGVVGLNSNYEEKVARVQNCVALNPGVATQPSGSTGRVAGSNMGSNLLENNHAREDMEIDKIVNNNRMDVDGADVSSSEGAGEYNNKAFWKKTLGWNFAKDGAWEWGPRNLPVLKNVGGVQHPKVQVLSQ